MMISFVKKCFNQNVLQKPNASEANDEYDYRNSISETI